MPVKKLFPVFGAIMILISGWVLHCTPVISGTAAWSRIIGSVNFSAWELYKPFAIVYLFWILIELSFLRPHLLHFVCSKLVGMYILCAAVLFLSVMLRGFMHEPYIRLSAAALGIILAQTVSYLLYSSSFPVESLKVPLILSLMCMVFLLLFLSFYPPGWAIFYDFYNGGSGHRIRDSAAAAELSRDILCNITAKQAYGLPLLVESKAFKVV